MSGDQAGDKATPLAVISLHLHLHRDSEGRRAQTADSMELDLETKEQFRQAQDELRSTIRAHQVWVTRLDHDRAAKYMVDKIEKEIIAIGRAQRELIKKLRKDLEIYRGKIKPNNRDADLSYHNYYIAAQLHEYAMQYQKKSKSLLKPSILNEISVKTENGKDKETARNARKNDQSPKRGRLKDDYDDDIEFIKATENFNLKDPIVKSSIDDRRTDFVNVLTEAKHSSRTPQVEMLSVKKSLSPRDRSPSPPLEPSPTPSPPPSLPLPGEPITQEKFLRLLNLVTPEQRILLEKKRSERKRRPTTSTNRNEFVYGNFDMPIKKKKSNFSYLQQNLTPPQTRAQKMRRQQLSTGVDSRNGESSSPPPSPPPWTNSFTFPSGLTIEPVIEHVEPKRCTVCHQSDTPSLLVHCTNCNKYFHSSCGSLKRPSSPASILPLSSNQRKRKILGYCPECSEEIKQTPSIITLFANHAHSNGASEDAYKEKIIIKQQLLEKNRRLTSDLRKLEMRAEALKENLKARNLEKNELLTNRAQTQRNLRNLLEFVNHFKETSVSVHSVSSGDRGDSSRASDDD